jgi:transcriptional regulator with XRE-family HTH domain
MSYGNVAKCANIRIDMTRATVHGTRIARLRGDHDLTQVQLSARSGVSLPSIQRAERGDPSISYNIARKLALALGVPIEQIYESDDVELGAIPLGAEPPTWFVEAVSDLRAEMERLIEFHRTGDRRVLEPDYVRPAT